jgi:hypothetical protein
MIISGSSLSGKSIFSQRLVKNIRRMVTHKIVKVIYCYGIFDPRIFELQKDISIPIEFYQGMPSLEFLQSCEKPMLLILDDLMKEAAKSGFLDTFFTKGSHHLDISVILITQDLFFKDLKTSRNNAHYIILMRNPAGGRQVRDLASQLFPGKKRTSFLESYTNATKENFGYLMIDIHPA